MNSIYSPNQNKFINLFSKNGIKILKSYIKHYQNGGSQGEGGATKESPLKSQIEELHQIKYGIDLPDTNKENVSFMMIGCWGRMTGDNVTLPRVAYDMAENIENHEFVISLGDNFYIKEPMNEEAFKEIWENNFFGEGKLNLPWYISLGNHAYSEYFCPNFLLSKHFVNRNWTLPSTYWSMIRNKCLFIFLDTTMIAEYFESKKKKKGKCSEMIIDDLRGKSSTMGEDAFMNLPMNPIGQIKWFQNTLMKYEPDENIHHIIVIGHHPIIAHGHKKKNPCIISKGLYNIIYNECIVEYNKYTSTSNKKYIKAYFCADEHNFQHLTHKQSIGEGENIDFDFHFIVAGTGGADNDLYETFPKNLEITGKIPEQPVQPIITNLSPGIDICEEKQVCNTLCLTEQEFILNKLITGENGWLSVNITPSEMNITFNGINKNNYSISI